MRTVVAIGKVVRRLCTMCGKIVRITLLFLPNGWERHTCQECGYTKEYKTE